MYQINYKLAVEYHHNYIEAYISKRWGRSPNPVFASSVPLPTKLPLSQAIPIFDLDVSEYTQLLSILSQSSSTSILTASRVIQNVFITIHCQETRWFVSSLLD